MQTTLIITGILIAFLLALFLIARGRMKNIPVVDDHMNILTLTDKNFQYQTKNKEVATELGDRIRVIKIDVDQNSEIASRYNIQSVPTLIIFKNGKLVWRQSGVVTKNQLHSVLIQNI